MTVSGKWLLNLLKLLLVWLIAYQLAVLTVAWLPLPAPHYDTEDITPPVPSASEHTTAMTYPSAEEIASWRLFGEVQIQTTPQPVVSAPETRLNLRLAGIFYRNENTLALIAEGNSPAEVYRVGDTLVAGVRVHQIQADKVILARGSQFEALSLPREDRPDNAVTTPVSNALPTAPAEQINASAIARQLRQQLAANPAALEQLAYATPHMVQGQFAGLRLRRGRDRRLLGRLGLQNGDVLTELNGVRITNPVQGLSLLQTLFDQAQVSAKIVRNGREIPYTFLLNP